MLNKIKPYTEPKLSPAKPKPCDLSKDWYVWFRFYDRSTDSWKQLRFKKGINEIKTFKQRLVEANALKQVLKEELQDGWNPFSKDPSVIRIYSLESGISHILTIKGKTLRKKSLYAYRYITACFSGWLKERGLLQSGIKTFTPFLAQQYMDWLVLEKKYSGRTFNDHLIVLRTFFNCFIERDWITKNPFRAVKRKTQTVGRNLAFTDAERTLLNNTLKKEDPRMWLFSQFLFHFFIRRTELTAIRVKHIDLVNGTIIIPGESAKNNTQESVTIPKGVEPMIRAMDLHRFGPEDFVFGRGLETGPRPYKNPNQISTRHNTVSKRLGISEEKGLYSWKHSGVCAYYYATGKDLYSVCRQLRHRDIKTTAIYLKSLGLLNNDVFKNALVA